MRLWREDLPAAALGYIYSRRRRTDQANGQRYMYFDIADGYPYAGQETPHSRHRRRVSYLVKVTFYQQGTDISLEPPRTIAASWSRRLQGEVLN